jgi:hypothetical protein
MYIMKFKDIIPGGGNLLLGAAIIVSAPIVVSALSAVARPLTKSAIKGGLLAYGRVRELAAEAREGLEDLTAEAMSEISEMEKTFPEAGVKNQTADKEG